MSNLIKLLDDLNRISVGFEPMFDRINYAGTVSTNYPPYNVIKLSDTLTVIEMAVAGFKPEDLDVSIANGLLTITGESSVDTDTVYLYRGIASRKFTRSWQLAENIEVKAAETNNGMLTITLEQLIPESAKPKKIAIKHGK
jgi:molecular chaperone IbpA